MLGRYDRCLLTSEHGRMRTYFVPKVGAADKPQLVALQEWADSLAKGMVVAFVADQADVHMEGVYWLAQLLDVAFPATAAMAHTSDVFKEGWLLVRARWYKFEPDAKHPKGWRGYSLLAEERLLVIGTSMLRLKDIKFESQPRRALRPAPRAPPPPPAAPPPPPAAPPAAAGRGRGRGRGRARGAQGRGSALSGGRGGGAARQMIRHELSWLGADTHNLIMACVRAEPPERVTHPEGCRCAVHS